VLYGVIQDYAEELIRIFRRLLLYSIYALFAPDAFFGYGAPYGPEIGITESWLPDLYPLSFPTCLNWQSVWPGRPRDLSMIGNKRAATPSACHS